MKMILVPLRLGHMINRKEGAGTDM